MLLTLLNFASLFSAALVSGALFGLWLLMKPGGLDARSYVILQQQGIRALNKVMPVLGATSIILTIAFAILEHNDRVRCWFLAGSAAFYLASGVITRFCNQPINSTIMAWKMDQIPSDWTSLRDLWWQWHRVRVATAFVALCLRIAATL